MSILLRPLFSQEISSWGTRGEGTVTAASYCIDCITLNQFKIQLKFNAFSNPNFYILCQRIWLTEPRCIVFLTLAGDKQRHMLLVFLTAWEMNLEFGPETRNLNPRGLEWDRAGKGWQRGSEWVVLSRFYLTHWEWVDQLASLWTIQTLLEVPCLLQEDFWGQKKDRSPSHRSRGRSRNSEERDTCEGICVEWVVHYYLSIWFLQILLSNWILLLFSG